MANGGLSRGRPGNRAAVCGKGPVIGKISDRASNTLPSALRSLGENRK